MYKLDTRSMSIQRISLTGKAPGWLYNHRADLINASAIRVTGGFRVQMEDEVPNVFEHVLDLEHLRWRQIR